MQQTITANRFFLPAGLTLLFGSLLVFSLSGLYAALLLPLAYIYLLLLITNWKAAYWVLICSIPLSVQVDLAGSSLSTSLPDEPMMWLFFLLALILIAANPARLSPQYLAHPLTAIIIIQFLWLIVAVCFSTAPLLSVKFMLAKSWYLACFFIIPAWIFHSKKDFRTAFLILLVPLLLTMAIITVRHASLQFGFTTINKAIGKLYFNHVEYSSVVSMFFPLLCIAYPLSRGRHALIRAFILLCILFFAFVIFFTYARAAIVGIAFAVVVAFAIRWKLVNYILPCFYILLASLLVYLVKDNRYLDYSPDYEHTYMRKNLGDHIMATFKGEDMSSMERLHRWIAAVRMSREHPVTGYGPHGFVENYKGYTIPNFQTYVSSNPERSTTHNYFLLMLTEQGWPAMLLYALLIAVAFSTAQRTYHRFKSRFYKNCTLGIAMMLAVCFINNFFSELIETHKIGALFYLGLALLIILSEKSKQEGEPA